MKTHTTPIRMSADEPDGRPRVIGEDQERGAVRNEPARGAPCRCRIDPMPCSRTPKWRLRPMYDPFSDRTESPRSASWSRARGRRFRRPAPAPCAAACCSTALPCARVAAAFVGGRGEQRGPSRPAARPSRGGRARSRRARDDAGSRPRGSGATRDTRAPVRRRATRSACAPRRARRRWASRASRARAWRPALPRRPSGSAVRLARILLVRRAVADVAARDHEARARRLGRRARVSAAARASGS